MTFGLSSWLKSQYTDLPYEVPIWYPSHDQPDRREWLVTNGLGGYASGTICATNSRRYHAALVSSLKQATQRHVILSKVDEVVMLDGRAYELASQHWASGVVSPTGYKLLESFTILPCPTWVYNCGGHYLIKQLCLPWDSNQVHFAYFWLPDRDAMPKKASITVRFLTGYRDFHTETRGSVDKRYPQVVGNTSTVIGLDNSRHALHLSWNRGQYDRSEQWWWGVHWPDEAARAMIDHEDLFYSGALTADLIPGQELNIAACLDEPSQLASCRAAIDINLKRQQHLLHRASLPKAPDTNLLILACDQFLVNRTLHDERGTSIIAGYPWLNEHGRDAMIAMPGLTLALRQFDKGKEILATLAQFERNGLFPSRFTDAADTPECDAADTSLWWAWSLYQYYRATKDLSFIKAQLPLLKNIAHRYIEGTLYGIVMDRSDGLLRIGADKLGLTWMDTDVENIPITPRSGKPVEICALWYNLLETILYFGKELNDDVSYFENIADLCGKSLQKFWNNEAQCLYDVIEPDNRPSAKPDGAVRPNQIFAISLPFRALTKLQEKAVLTTIDRELFTPLGLRSLSPTHPSYQGQYGCGLPHADQYHRNISYHQGCVWPWLMGAYCDALLNVHGPLPETYAKIRILLQPLLNNLMEEGCVGSISEVVDGNAPHIPHGTSARAWSVAETMRILAHVLRSG